MLDDFFGEVVEDAGYVERRSLYLIKVFLMHDDD